MGPLRPPYGSSRDLKGHSGTLEDQEDLQQVLSGIQETDLRAQHYTSLDFLDPQNPRH